MTDLTDQELRDAIEWGRRNEYSGDPAEANAAIVILATVEAPEPTIAEDILDAAAHIRDAVNPFDRDVSWADMESCAYRAKQAEHDRDEARAEVERLTAVNENLRRTDNYREFKELLGVQKGAESNAESNAESIDPDDVKPGEAWIVECRGERCTAVKDRDDTVPWCTINADGWYLSEDNENVTLVTRLVPAPRVITSHDELDALPDDTIVRIDEGGDAMRKYKGKWHPTSNECCYESRHIALPVTVLREPEA